MSAVAFAAPGPVETLVSACDAPAATPSLDAAVAERWSALTGGAAAECLVCGGEMAPRWSAGRGAVGGRCGSCGTSLE